MCILAACSGKVVRNVDLSAQRFTAEKPWLIVEWPDAEGVRYKGKEPGLYKVTSLKKNFQVEVHYFLSKQGPFEIVFIHFDVPPSRIVYFPDEWYAEEIMFGIVVGEQVIKGQRWLKTVKFGDQGWFSKNKDWLYAGYFIKRGDFLIFVSTGADMYQREFDVKRLKKSRKPTSDQLAFIEAMFQRAALMYRIVE